MFVLVWVRNMLSKLRFTNISFSKNWKIQFVLLSLWCFAYKQRGFMIMLLFIYMIDIFQTFVLFCIRWEKTMMVMLLSNMYELSDWNKEILKGIMIVLLFEGESMDYYSGEWMEDKFIDKSKWMNIEIWSFLGMILQIIAYLCSIHT